MINKNKIILIFFIILNIKNINGSYRNFLKNIPKGGPAITTLYDKSLEKSKKIQNDEIVYNHNFQNNYEHHGYNKAYINPIEMNKQIQILKNETYKQIYQRLNSLQKNENNHEDNNQQEILFSYSRNEQQPDQRPNNRSNIIITDKPIYKYMLYFNEYGNSFQKNEFTNIKEKKYQNISNKDLVKNIYENNNADNNQQEILFSHSRNEQQPDQKPNKALNKLLHNNISAQYNKSNIINIIIHKDDVSKIIISLDKDLLKNILKDNNYQYLKNRIILFLQNIGENQLAQNIDQKLKQLLSNNNIQEKDLLEYLLKNKNIIINYVDKNIILEQYHNRSNENLVPILANNDNNISDLQEQTIVEQEQNSNHTDNQQLEIENNTIKNNHLHNFTDNIKQFINEHPKITAAGLIGAAVLTGTIIYSYKSSSLRQNQKNDIEKTINMNNNYSIGLHYFVKELIKILKEKKLMDNIINNMIFKKIQTTIKNKKDKDNKDKDKLISEIIYIINLLENKNKEKINRFIKYIQSNKSTMNKILKNDIKNITDIINKSYDLDNQETFKF
jgi:hypothetical protein